MALSANSVFEVRTAGNDTNGGGFVTGAAGTDYSQQDNKNTAGADISTIDGVGNGTTTFTSATANFGTTIVGNIIYLQGGTGALAAGRYQVTARASATSITLDRAVAAGTGIMVNIGGAVLTLGILGSTTATILVDGNKIFIKAGTYLITSTTANISGGRFNKANVLYIEGYQTTRGDLGTPPLLQASGIATFTVITLSGSGCIIKNINVDCALLTASKGFALSDQNIIVYKCTALNCTNSGFYTTGYNTKLYYCIATGCTTVAAFNGGSLYNCIAHANTTIGFRALNAERCIAYGNTGATTDGFISDPGGSADALFTNCISYANGRDGYRIDGINTLLINCIAESNTGVGFNFGATNPRSGQLFNCAGFSAGTNVALGTGTFINNTGFITGSGSFFTNSGAGDFSLNATAGRGAALRAAGLPGIFPVGLTTGYLDIGAAQHQDAGGGGSSEHSSVF